MMSCPLSFVHKPFALLTISLCREGGDRGGVRINVRRAEGEAFTLRTDGVLMRCKRFPPRSRWQLGVAVLLRLREDRLCETVGGRCLSVVHGGRSSSVSAVRVGSCHGWRGWCRVVLKLHRLFSHFRIAVPSVREPEERNRKLLITQHGSMDYHLQVNQIIHCGRGLVLLSCSCYDYDQG